MKEKLEKVGLSIPKTILSLTLSLFGLLSIIYVALTNNELFSYFYCLATVVFAALPLILSVLFRWKMNFLFYLLFSFYCFGPLLGAVYNLYYFITWWDDLLHILAGLIFAVVGANLAYVMNKNRNISYVFAAFFGVLISMGIAMVWEFYEFSSDMLLHSDMQSDTIIYDIYTKINRFDGGVDAFENIQETIVNGESLGIVGYLDIGLIDTMTDMFVETMGAVAFFIYVIIDKNRHPMIQSIKKEKNIDVLESDF